MKKDGKTSSNGQEHHRGISSGAIRRPVGTLAITSVIIVLGFFFFDRLPLDLLPEINYPTIRATVNYPGTPPEVMERQITRVLERNLASTENLIEISSRASEGRTNVNLVFEYGTNIDLALQDASRNLELARTQMPSDIEPPRLYKFDPAQDPVFEAGFSSTVRSPIEVRDWLENELAPQIQSIHGVGGVEVAGGQVREMQVVLDQDRLISYGLTVSQILDALREENRDIAAGQVTDHRFDVMAKTDARFQSVHDIANVMLPIPGSNRMIPVSEVAEVKDTHQDQRLFVRLDGQPAMRLSVTKLPDANTVQVIDGVRAELKNLQRSGFIPEDIIFTPTTDQSFFIRSSISAVSTAAVLGGVLAMMIVLLFLGSLRKGFVIGLSIPIAIMATFTMMGMSGITLNIMSLGGLALGVGLLLDNSIVMLENIFRHREQHRKNADQSAHEGSREVTSAIIASTMTNLAAVVPFLLITGLAAMLFRELILTISFAIVASLAAALTLVPMLSALLSKIRFRSGIDRSRFHHGFNRGMHHTTNGYKSVVSRVLRYRYVVVVISFLALFGVLRLTDNLGNEFLPQVDDALFSVWMGLPPGATPDVTNEYALQIEGAINEMPHVQHVFSMTGGHLSGGVISERPGTARLNVQLDPASERGMDAMAWVTQMEGKVDSLAIPGARIFVRPPSIRGIRTNLAGSDISLGIVGDDIEELDRLGRDLLYHLDGIEGLADFDISRDDRSPVLNVNVDRERAASHGFKSADIGDAVRTAVLGSVPTRFSTGITEYDIRVMYDRSKVRDDEQLSEILLPRSDGRAIPVSEMASFSLGDGPAHIERENQVRIIRLNGEVNTAVSDVGTVNDEIRERMASYELPEGYSLIYGGEEEVIRETQRNLVTVILLAIFLVFVVLAVQYERLANPLVILMAVPLALIGVGLMLWTTGTNLSAPVMLGVILLVGIVVNNAILLVEYIEIGRREHNLEPFEAVVEAGGIRFRPIMMTTLTTVFGMMPLAIGLGEGAELMRPLAIAVVGGLLISTLLTLFIVPSLYLIINAWGEKFKVWVTGHTMDPAFAVSGNGDQARQRERQDRPEQGEQQGHQEQKDQQGRPQQGDGQDQEKPQERQGVK